MRPNEDLNPACVGMNRMGACITHMRSGVRNAQVHWGEFNSITGEIIDYRRTQGFRL